MICDFCRMFGPDPYCKECGGKMLPGETIGSGASPQCEDCGLQVVLNVYRSAAGYYIGSYCDCGPYSRESDYYQYYDEAYNDFERNCWLAR